MSQYIHKTLTSVPIIVILSFQACVFLQHVGAEESMHFTSSAALIEYIEILRRDPTQEPVSLVKKAQVLIKTSQDQGWEKAYLYARVFKLENYVNQSNAKAAQQLYKELLPLTRNVKDKRITAYMFMSDMHLRLLTNETENIEALYPPLLELTKSIKDDFLEGDIHISLGITQSRTGDVRTAILSYKAAYDCYLNAQDIAGQAKSLIGLGNEYSVIGDNNLALSYYEKALNIAQAAGNKFGESIILLNVADIYLMMNNEEKARETYLNAMQASELAHFDIGVSMGRMGLAKVYISQKDWLNALELTQQLESENKAVGDLQTLFVVHLFQAKSHLGLHNVNAALIAVEKAKMLQGGSENTQPTMDLQAVIEEIAVYEKDFEVAYYNLKTRFEWFKENVSEENVKQLQRLKIEFDTQLKEKLNESLQQDNELKQLKIDQQRNELKIWVLILALCLAVILIIGIVLIFQTKNRNRFKNMAMNDFLTSSPNRRAILQFAKEQFNRSRRYKVPLTVALIDLDYFKQLNDQYGHDVGDKVLIEFAKVCVKTLREQDKFGRYGGEEWLLVMPDTELAHSFQVFERLRKEMESVCIGECKADTKVRFSMGAAKRSDKDVSIEALIKRADENLYLAKEQGRDKVVC